MDSRPSEHDRSLLERLNALKLSSVQLEPRKIPLGEEVEDAVNPDPVLDLEARFLGLGYASTRNISGFGSGSGYGLGADVDHEEDVDALLDELRDRICAGSGEDEEQQQEVEEATPAENHEEVRNLVKDAKSFVASSSRLTGAAHEIASNVAMDGPLGNDHDDEILDKEAAEYIQQAMAEIRANTGRDFMDELASPDTEENNKISSGVDDHQPATVTPKKTSFSAIIDLPDTPTAAPRSPDQGQTQNQKVQGTEEQQPDLPTAPTFLPAEHPIHITNNRKGSVFSPRWVEPSLPSSWCCICSDNARVKCLDCGDGELLYCARCWREVHFDEGGPEEREHRAVEFTGNMEGAVG